MKTLVAPAALIIRHDLRLLWRTLQGDRRGWTSYALLAFLVFLLHAVIVTALWGAKSLPPAGVQALIWAVVLCLMIGGAMNQAISLLFTRSDFDLLLASPLPARALLLGRLGSVAISTFLTAAIFVSPVLNSAIIRFSPRYAGAYVVLALLAVLAASLATGGTLFLVRWFGVPRARLMAMVIAAGFGASLSLVTMVPAFLPKAKFQELRQGFLYVMQHPALTAVADAARGSPLPLALFALVVAGAVALTVRLLDRTFVSGLQTIGSSSTRRRRTADHRWISSSGPAGVRKEFRLITRSPLLVLQLLPMVFLLAPLAFLLPKIGGLPLLPPVALFVASIFSFLLAEVACAGEVGWDLVRLSPTPESRARWIKMIACLFLPLLVALALCVWVALAGRPWLALFTFVISSICATGCAWVGVVTIKASPRYDLIAAPNQPLDLRQFFSMAILFPGTAGIALVSFEHYALGLPLVGATLLCILGCFTLLEPRGQE